MQKPWESKMARQQKSGLDVLPNEYIISFKTLVMRIRGWVIYQSQYWALLPPSTYVYTWMSLSNNNIAC